MNPINTLKNIYDKIKISYNDYWAEYEKAMESLSPQERMEIMAVTQSKFNFMNQ